MVDVARAAGVSVQTVSRVVNHGPKVSPQTAARVSEAIEQLGFRRNAGARNLRVGSSTATVGLVTEDVANPFYASVTAGVEDVVRQHDSLLITASSQEDPERVRATVLDLCQRRVDGLLIVPSGPDVSYLRREIKQGTPVVFLDRPAGRLGADTVLLDNVGGSRAAVDELVRDGHRRIAAVGAALDIHTVQERLRGYREALRDAGIAFDDELLRLGPMSPAEAGDATRELLSLRRPPTAFFALNNRMTIGVVTALFDAGTSAAVAGFDDVETARLLPIPTVLVSYDPFELGRTGARLLFRRIAGWTGRPRHITIPTSLVRHAGVDAGRSRRSSRSSTRGGTT